MEDIGDEKEERTRNELGETKRGRRGAYKAATRTVFWPDMLGVNLAPMVQMSFLRYSRASPV